MALSIYLDINIAYASIDFTLILAEHCERKSQLPWESPAEEWEEQTGREPLLRKEATSRSDRAAGKEEAMAGTYFVQFPFSQTGKAFKQRRNQNSPFQISSSG